MIPLTPLGLVIVGAWLIAHLTTIPLIVTVVVGIVAVVCGLVDIAVRGHRVP